VTTRRTTVLVAAAVVGGVLVPVGALLLYLGTTDDRGGESVAGILALVLGLAGFRVLFWLRRVGRLTRVGLSFHDPEDDPGPPG
jgi:membrane-bound ClpP family serine protease